MQGDPFTNPDKQKRGRKLKICLVASSGGHLTELLQFVRAFQGHEVFLITNDLFITRDLTNAYLIKEGKDPDLSVVVLVFRLLLILFKEKPDVIISTGCFIAIPTFFLGKFLFRAKVIFIESAAQVISPSKTGRIVYPISDLFFVQWASCKQCYGKKARYVGGLI